MEQYAADYWDSKREETRRLRASRQRSLSSAGAAVGVDARRRQQTTPHLLNLSEDPMMCGALVYILPQVQARRSPTR